MDNVECCVICLDEMERSNTFIMGCSHKLHTVCFKTYFYYNYDIEANSICCPICRTRIDVERRTYSTLKKHKYNVIIQLIMYISTLSLLVFVISTFVSSLEIE
jgi:hypothetical protein